MGNEHELRSRGPETAGWLAWPAMWMTGANELIAASLEQRTGLTSREEVEAEGEGQLLWASPHRLRLELGTMELRDFSVGESGVPTLVCAPFALHRADIADLAPGHSIVEALCQGGCGRVHVTDWRSATPEMRFLSIDNYVADLNVAVDDLGPPVDLVGLCQGGWLALTFAARFPQKVRRLVLAGAPIDIAAGDSMISRWAVQTPMAAIDAYLDLHEGRVLGNRALHVWGPALSVKDERHILQVLADDHSAAAARLVAHFQDWYGRTVDLPGTYYREVVCWLYKENQLAEGRLTVLGRRIDLASVRHPTFLLGADDDTLVSPEQLFATRARIGAPPRHIETATEPCGHLSLFVGAEAIKRSWARIARWLGEELTPA